MTVRTMTIDGVATRVVEDGPLDAPAVVLLHGVGGHLEAFDHTVPALATDHRVIRYDLPGHGWSSAPGDRSYEIDGYVDHLVALLDQFGLGRPALVGLSLGGWVAARFAVDRPDRAGPLALLAPGGVRADPAVMTAIRSLSTTATQEPTRESVRARLEWLMADPAAVPEALVSTRLAIYTRPGAGEAMQRVLCLQDPDIRARNMLAADAWGRIAVPTLVVWGDRDGTGPASTGADLAGWLPLGRFVLVPDAGHWPQYERPDVVNRALIDFLAATPVPTRSSS